MLSKILTKLDQIFGKLMFRSLLPLSYILINKKLYKKIKYHANSTNQRNLIEDGYIVVNNNFSEIADEINEKLKIEKESNAEIQLKPVHYYEISENLKETIKKFAKHNLKSIITEISKFYKMPIFIANVTLRKTNHINTNEEKFNNFFHNDIYLGNHFKLFFNLHDMNSKNGPTVIIPSKETKKILNLKNRFSKRGLFVQDNDLKKKFTNNLKKGNLIICNTCECLHKASVPELHQSRDILTLTLVAFPDNNINDLFFFEEEFSNEIWNGNSNLAKRYSKPNLNRIFEFYKALN